MDLIKIEGGTALKGELAISGSKNAVLPLMVAGLLSDQPLVLKGTPRLADTRTLADVLRFTGAEVDEFGIGADESIRVDASQIKKSEAPYELVSKMRASFWVIGPLLARFGHAKVSLPGGCAIGTRPVDLYLAGLREMGVQIDVEEGYVIAKAPKGLKGARINMPYVSVGVTHVLLMAATLADGITNITNAATEPEVVDVANCLVTMGAKIEGIGTRNLRITGVSSLSGATHNVIRDRIEGGAFALAAAATRGEVTLTGITTDMLGALVPAMRFSGVDMTDVEGGVFVKSVLERPHPISIATEPYPGFATDLQAPFMGYMCLADGVSHIRETIFENRFMHVQELARLGAQIELDGDTAIVTGVPELHGAPVMATDLRASVTLVIAGLVGKGVTTIRRVYHLDRGYERLEEKLSGCGARIWRESE